MRVLVLIAAGLSLAACQEMPIHIEFHSSPVGTNPAPGAYPAISIVASQERGGNSPSTLNPPVTATVTDSPIAVNSGAAGNQ